MDDNEPATERLDDHPISALLRVTVVGVAPAPIRILVDGEVDTTTVRRVCDALVRAVAPGSEIHLDLSGVRFLGAAGLAALAEAHGRAARSASVIRIVRPSRTARRALAITGVDLLFEVEP